MGEATIGGELLRAVRDLVHRTLCSRDNLRSDCFKLTELPLKRDEELCGWHFCLHGPRQLRLTAIWDVESGSILFYGSQGERFMTVPAPCVA